MVRKLSLPSCSENSINSAEMAEPGAHMVNLLQFTTISYALRQYTFVVEGKNTSAIKPALLNRHK